MIKVSINTKTIMKFQIGFKISLFSKIILTNKHIHPLDKYLSFNIIKYYPIYPTPPLGQDMTQGQFLSRV